MLDRRRRTVSWTFARARLEDGAGVCTNIGKILGNTMVFKPLATSHNPNLTAYDADGGRPGTGEGSPGLLPVPVALMEGTQASACPGGARSGSSWR